MLLKLNPKFRHLFMDVDKVAGETTLEKLESVYQHNKPMATTRWGNESSPEIVGVLVNQQYRS